MEMGVSGRLVSLADGEASFFWPFAAFFFVPSQSHDLLLPFLLLPASFHLLICPRHPLISCFLFAHSLALSEHDSQLFCHIFLCLLFHHHHEFYTLPSYLTPFPSNYLRCGARALFFHLFSICISASPFFLLLLHSSSSIFPAPTCSLTHSHPLSQTLFLFLPSPLPPPSPPLLGKAS